MWGSCKQALTPGILRDRVDQLTLQPSITVQNKLWSQCIGLASTYQKPGPVNVILLHGLFTVPVVQL